MSSATLFFQNLSSIDLATIDPVTQTVRGGSYNYSLWVTGEIEEHEQVVVDFSTLKHNIKRCMDDKIGGFDHKLWVTPKEYENFISKINPDGSNLFIETPNFSCCVPAFTVRVVDFIDIGPEGEIAFYLEKKMSLLYPEANLTFKVFLSENKNTLFYGSQDLLMVSSDFAFKFRYVHGLKNSTSEGCQNINHGHCSYMGIIGAFGQPLDLTCQIPDFTKYKDVIFIHQDNVVSKSKDWISIAYKAKTGFYIARYNLATKPVMVLPCETTVENLGHWIASKHRNQLKDVGAKYLLVSEGLTKGSVVEL